MDNTWRYNWIKKSNNSIKGLEVTKILRDLGKVHWNCSLGHNRRDSEPQSQTAGTGLPRPSLCSQPPDSGNTMLTSPWLLFPHLQYKDNQITHLIGFIQGFSVIIHVQDWILPIKQYMFNKCCLPNYCSHHHFLSGLQNLGKSTCGWESVI